MTWVDVDGLHVTEGDLLLTDEQLASLVNVSGDSVSASLLGLIVPVGNNHWDCPIPYVFESGFGDPDKVRRAMAEIERLTRWRFVERTTEANYLEVLDSEGCLSYVGRVFNGKQAIWIHDVCSVSAGVHELLHAIGVHHEEGRSDRDEYINIDWDNLEPGDHFGSNPDDPHWQYDYTSVMHTGPFASPINLDFPTVTEKHPNLEVCALGVSPGGPSRGDVAAAMERFKYTPNNQCGANVVSPSYEVCEEGDFAICRYLNFNHYREVNGMWRRHTVNYNGQPTYTKLRSDNMFIYRLNVGAHEYLPFTRLGNAVRTSTYPNGVLMTGANRGKKCGDLCALDNECILAEFDSFYDSWCYPTKSYGEIVPYYFNAVIIPPAGGGSGFPSCNRVTELLGGECTTTAEGFRLSATINTELNYLSWMGYSFDDSQSLPGNVNPINICLLALYGNQPEHIDYVPNRNSFTSKGGGTQVQHWMGNCAEGSNCTTCTGRAVLEAGFTWDHSTFSTGDACGGDGDLDSRTIQVHCKFDTLDMIDKYKWVIGQGGVGYTRMVAMSDNEADGVAPPDLGQWRMFDTQPHTEPQRWSPHDELVFRKCPPRHKPLNENLIWPVSNNSVLGWSRGYEFQPSANVRSFDITQVGITAGSNGDYKVALFDTNKPNSQRRIWESTITAESCGRESPGTDVSNAVRTSANPHGFVGSKSECCRVCTEDPECTAVVYATSDPNRGMCWIIASFSGTHGQPVRSVIYPKETSELWFWVDVYPAVHISSDDTFVVAVYGTSSRHFWVSAPDESYTDPDVDILHWRHGTIGDTSVMPTTYTTTPERFGVDFAHAAACSDPFRGEDSSSATLIAAHNRQGGYAFRPGSGSNLVVTSLGMSAGAPGRYMITLFDGVTDKPISFVELDIPVRDVWYSIPLQTQVRLEPGHPYMIVAAGLEVQCRFRRRSAGVLPTNEAITYDGAVLCTSGCSLYDAPTGTADFDVYYVDMCYETV